MGNACPSCGRKLNLCAVELLSNPELGFVADVRPGQIELTRSMEEMFKAPGHKKGLYEGGCGIGKTFVYGVTAALTRQRTVIATGKKSLQDQLGDKDLAYIQQQLGVPRAFVSLKGKSNYLCARLLRKKRKLFVQQGKEKLWERLTEWVEENPTGDLDTFPGKMEYPATICTASDCSCGKRSKNCGHALQKEAAKQADMVVINHSLLGFDLRLGVGRIFGPYSHLIIDEAHASPDFIRRAFAEEISPKWMRNVYNKLLREQVDYKSQRDPQEKAWAGLFADVPETRLLDAGFFGPALQPALDALTVLDEDLTDVIYRQWHPVAESAKKAIKLADLLVQVEDDLYHASDENAYDEFMLLVKLFEDTAKKRAALSATQSPEDNWINCREEMRDGGCKIVRQPVDIAPLVRGPLSQIDKVAFTSATLNFDVMKSEFGIMPDYEVSVPSPFPYGKSLVYLPKHLPRPNEQGWHFSAGKEIVQLVRASKGNALVLFSSMRDLRAIHDAIQVNYDLEYPILAQGDGRRPTEVFQEFMDTEDSVLFGSKSFFEGIDVQGGKLRLVIVAKIPFPPREDPLNKAKERSMGGQAFWNRYYFPSMLNDIQQAFGRLVRTKADRGVVALLDVRIWVGGKKDLDPREVGTAKVPWRGYGHRIIKSLPFPNFTPRFSLVQQYFDSLLRSE
ncbi:MAG: ATP-dependent DNA helicase [Planctomycetota bacterium]|jgi:ATP-dependent DNA helicase DinG